MTVPTSYTEKTLAEYMHTVLDDVATPFGWAAGASDAGDYAEAVYETLLAYGADDVTDISGSENIARLRSLARVEVWRKVVDATAGHYDFREAAGAATFNRSQVHKQALANMRNAEAEAFRHGAYGYSVVVQSMQHVHDPYQYVEDDDRGLTP